MNMDNEALLKGFESLSLSYSLPETSYSPFYSNIGLECAEQKNGVGNLWLHFNRRTRVLFEKTADFEAPLVPGLSAPWLLRFEGNGVFAWLTFFAPDCMLLRVKGQAVVPLFTDFGTDSPNRWLTKKDGVLLYHTFSQNPDERDPDEYCPVLTGLKAVSGNLHTKNGKLYAQADENGELLLALCIQVLETNEEAIVKTLKKAPQSMEIAVILCKAMFKDCLKDFQINAPEKALFMLTKASNGLISNLSKAPGKLKGHIAAYPSRGYASHYIWDTCFQNLAYEKMNPALAEDFLTLLADCQRSDGKYEQFLCGTWGRPHYTQPSLVGWASLRLYLLTGNKDFAEKMLISLEKNNLWWVSNRQTRYGVLYCPHGLETGQDDSPRFDNGATLATDMNSYFYNQLVSTAELCKALGYKKRAQAWLKKADALGKAMVDCLYDEKDNFFYDVSLKTGQKIRLISPVGLLPLWAGVKLPEEKIHAMLRAYLLNPRKLFGEVPFPSVAYDEPLFTPDGWWRGPTWMPQAWLMLETLQKYGYSSEYQTAAERLYHVLINDKKMHELFNALTGEGLGDEEQGWSCAVFFKLCEIVNREGTKNQNALR